MSSVKLEKLSQEQEQLMFQTRDQWVAHFFNTKEINKSDFEEGIDWLYTDLLKKKKPKIIYCTSWNSALILIELLKNRDSVWASVGASVRASVRASVGASVRASVGDSVWDSVRASVRASVGDSVGASVGDSVWASVRDSVWDSVRASVWESSDSISSYSNYGWVSFYDYFEQIGVLDNLNFKKYKKLIKAGAFQAYEYEDIVFAIQPPTKILRNEQGQMNSIEEKAFEWSDDVGFYYVNGFELKEELFLKLKNNDYTLEEFVNEPNEEIKSAVIGFIQQRDGEFGIYNFFKNHLTETDSFVDKKQPHYLEGTTGGMNVGVYVLHKGIINNTNVAYIQCYCPSTDRMFFLGVEPHHTSAKDAIASLYQVPELLKNNIKAIARQGEKFSTIFDEETTLKLKNNKYDLSELNNYVSLSGDEYFSKMTYEY